MAYRDLDAALLAACCEDRIELGKVEALLYEGADVNAVDPAYDTSLYDEILDHYIDSKHKKTDLEGLLGVTELFLLLGLEINLAHEDDYFMPQRFRFMPPEERSVSIFKLLIDRGNASFEDLDRFIGDAILELHREDFYFYEGREYTVEDSLRYYLELIYWAVAYNLKRCPEKCLEALSGFDLFKREKNIIGFTREERSTTVFLEEVASKKRCVIGGFTWAY